MPRFSVHPVAAALLAIAITTTLDVAGALAFSALPLLPLGLACWWLSRLSRDSVGLVFGARLPYLVAVVHPAFVMGAIAITASVAGAYDISHVAWGRTLAKAIGVGGATIVMALLTEEGFFRGWLWAAFRARGMSSRVTWIATSVIFALWHISAVVLPTGFDVPAARVPLFIVNAAVMGAIWGMVRWRSGSIIASSVAHGLWNGFAYVLFGFGTKTGALGIRDTQLYGPEVGVLGLALNVVFLLIMWFVMRPDDESNPSLHRPPRLREARSPT